MAEKQEEKGLSVETVWFMIGTALFFDLLQALFTVIFMGWLVGIFAGLTFWFWFKRHGIKFNKASRWGSFAFTYLIEVIPVLSAVPAWTAEVSYLALTNKLQDVVPGAGVTKLGIGEVTKGKVLGFKARQEQAHQEKTSTEQYEEAA